MDRNVQIIMSGYARDVALRKESVDRNIMFPIDVLAVSVALRKESVDRNSQTLYGDVSCPLSLSARRAWIEMSTRVALN